MTFVGRHYMTLEVMRVTPKFKTCAQLNEERIYPATCTKCKITRVLGLDAATCCAEFFYEYPQELVMFGYFNVPAMRATAAVANDMMLREGEMHDSEGNFGQGGQDHPVILAA